MVATPSRDETIPSGKFVAPPLPTERQAAWGIGFFGLFLLPFCAVGIVTGYDTLVRALAGDWRQAGFYLVFCLLFGGIGFGLLAAIAFGRKSVAARIERAQAHPDEPWLLRPDWAAKQVRDDARGGMWFSIVFAVVWNLIAIPLAIAVVPALRTNPYGLVAFLFPLVGVVLAVWAMRGVLRYRRFGVSQLDLERVPIPVGHPFVGTVRAAIDTPPSDGFHVVLACIDRRTTGTGDNQTTTETIRWQEERRIPGVATRDFRAAAVNVPIAIAIPADAPGTDESRPRDVTVWRLAVSASLPGIDYAATFDVPVYYTAESARPASADEAAEVAHAVTSEPLPAPSSITVTQDADGTTIVFPAFRNPGPTLSLAAFSLLWTGTIWVQLRLGVPIFFPAVTSLFAVLLWWFVLAMALASSRVVVRADGLTVVGRFLGIARRHAIAAADVDGIELPIQMQAGSTPYYSILVRRRAVPGRTLAGAITVGTGIRDKREAERLAATIATALGRAPTPSG